MARFGQAIATTEAREQEIEKPPHPRHGYGGNCTGRKVMLYFALAGSGDPVQTNGSHFRRGKDMIQKRLFYAFSHMRERATKFNVEKIKPQDLAGAAGPPDEET